MTCCTKYRASVAVTVTGFVLLLGGLVMSGFFLSYLESQIDDGITVHTSGKSFDEWKSTFHPDDPPKYWNVYHYNVTNPKAVAHGATPHVEEIGPFVFREYKVRYNVTFHDSNKAVEYSTRYQYVREPERTAPLSLETRITNVWLPFLLLNGQIVDALEPLLESSLGQLLQKLVPNFAAIVDELALELVTEQLSLQKAIEVAARVECAPSAVITPECFASAVMQWGSLSGLSNPAVHVDVKAGESYASSAAIKALLNRTPEGHVLEQILEGVASAHLFPELGAYTKFTKNATAAMLTPAESMALVLGKYIDSKVPHFACPLLNASHNLVVNNHSIPDGVPCPLLFSVIALIDKAHLADVWPLSPTQLELLGGYLSQTTQAVLKVVSEIGGVKDGNPYLWTSRRPDQWLFEFVDPLLVMLGLTETGFNSAFFPDNTTTDAEAYLDDRTTEIVYTGKDKPTKSNFYKQWGGYTVMPSRHGSVNNPGVWCNGDVPVTGHMDTQQPPGKRGSWFTWKNRITSDSEPEVFVSDVYRTVDFSYYSDTKVKDIDALRFRISDKSFAVNELYSQEQFGLVNMTCPSGGQPVFLTLPRYLRASAAVQAMRPDGMLPPVPAKHETFLDVDPITGATLRGFQRLQVNVLVPSPVLNRTLLMPVMYIEETSQLTDKQASDYKDKVVFAFDLHRYLLYSLGVVGGVLFLCGAAATVILRRRMQTTSGQLQYEEGLLSATLLNDGTDSSQQQGRAPY